MLDPIAVGVGFLSASNLKRAVQTFFGPAAGEIAQTLGDEAKLFRARNLAGVLTRAQRMVDERQLPPEIVKALPLGDALRAAEAASLEDEDDMQDLWARLIANACTSDEGRIAKAYIELLKSLSPLEAGFLAFLQWADLPNRRFRPGPGTEALKGRQTRSWNSRGERSRRKDGTSR